MLERPKEGEKYKRKKEYVGISNEVFKVIAVRRDGNMVKVKGVDSAGVYDVSTAFLFSNYVKVE